MPWTNMLQHTHSQYRSSSYNQWPPNAAKDHPSLFFFINNLGAHTNQSQACCIPTCQCGPLTHQSQHANKHDSRNTSHTNNVHDSRNTSHTNNAHDSRNTSHTNNVHLILSTLSQEMFTGEIICHTPHSNDLNRKKEKENPHTHPPLTQQKT